MLSPLSTARTSINRKYGFERRKLFVDNEKNDRMNNPKEIQLASALFVIVGIGYLFPFTALTQPVDYWHLLFPDFNIEFLITSVFMYINLIMLGILVFFGGHPNFNRRVIGGFLGQLIVLLFIPTSYFFIQNEKWNKISILGATAFVAIATAFIDSSLIALSSQYPLSVQESFQLGIGLSSLIGSLYRDITKLVFPPKDIAPSSLLYFYTGATTILLCIASYIWLMKLPLTKRCLSSAEVKNEEFWHPEEETVQLINVLKQTKGYGEINGSEIVNDVIASSKSNFKVKWTILKKVLFNEIMVLLLFVSTLALWPPLVTEMKSFNFPELQHNGWWPLILLTFFSIADCCGRLMVKYRGYINRDNIWIPVLLRFLFFPLIILSVKGIFFTHDFWSIFFVSALGYTNGYIGTLTIVLVNECIAPHEQAIAGGYTSFFLNTGLVLGASAGLIMQKLVVGK